MRDQLQIAIPALAQEPRILAALLLHPGDEGLAGGHRRPKVPVERRGDVGAGGRAKDHAGCCRGAGEEKIASIYELGPRGGRKLAEFARERGAEQGRGAGCGDLRDEAVAPDNRRVTSKIVAEA